MVEESIKIAVAEDSNPRLLKSHTSYGKLGYVSCGEAAFLRRLLEKLVGDDNSYSPRGHILLQINQEGTDYDHISWLTPIDKRGHCWH